MKCNFVAELFIAPSASVASGVLSSEMPLKLITSMPRFFLSLFHTTTFPFFLTSAKRAMAYQLQSLELYKVIVLDSFEFQECVKGFLLPFCPSAAHNAGKDSVVVASF